MTCMDSSSITFYQNAWQGKHFVLVRRNGLEKTRLFGSVQDKIVLDREGKCHIEYFVIALCTLVGCLMMVDSININNFSLLLLCNIVTHPTRMKSVPHDTSSRVQLDLESDSLGFESSILGSLIPILLVIIIMLDTLFGNVRNLNK